MRKISCGLSVVVFAGTAALAADPAPAAKEMGDLWEVTSQMSMEGMPAGFAMPAQIRKVCAAKEWSKPPVPADERSKCEMIDFKATPTKSTWKMQCAGPPAMTGEGEITRSSPDAYSGWMKMAAPQGTMTMNLTGRRIGECDAGEAKKEREAAVARIQAQVAAAEQTAADAKRQTCMAPVESMDLRTLNMQAVVCDDPSYKAAFCDRLKTYDAQKQLCAREKSEPDNGLTAAVRACAADETALRKSLCDQATKLEDFNSIGGCCPDETQKLAAEHCAGRTYTSMAGDKYQPFCVTYAREAMDASKNAPPAETPGPKAKKSLKSLIPH
jgi:hypothetical protein